MEGEQIGEMMTDNGDRVVETEEDNKPTVVDLDVERLLRRGVAPDELGGSGGQQSGERDARVVAQLHVAVALMGQELAGLRRSIAAMKLFVGGVLIVATLVFLTTIFVLAKT